MDPPLSGVPRRSGDEISLLDCNIKKGKSKSGQNIRR